MMGPDESGSLRQGENCWRVERATRTALIVDADDYFRHARAAMLKAQHRIMLIGWDFDARIDLIRAGVPDEAPATVGDLIYWLVQRNSELEVYLLRWDVGAVWSLFRGTTIFTLIKWMSHERIHTRLDRAHPIAASHHQKLIVIDDSFAFCGGIDVTGDRWDTREHRDDDPCRRRPNGTPYGAWHDATSALEGNVASALGELSRERWRRASGEVLQPVVARTDCWPTGLTAQFENVDVAIARSEPEMPDHTAVLEIEKLWLDQIGRAERFVYAENQYFASHRIAEAIARRLDGENPPEIVIINPLSASGWLETLAMDTARARLHEALRRHDRHGRFRIFHPFTVGGEPIYVHAKILVVDDRILRVGSSNMNNRSLRLDTECDVTIDAERSVNSEWRPMIRTLRDGLIAEHLGVEVAVVTEKIAATGSLIASIESLRGTGKTLRDYETPDLLEVEKWLADNPVLDPDSAETFEPLKGGLFRRGGRFLRKFLRGGQVRGPRNES